MLVLHLGIVITVATQPEQGVNCILHIIFMYDVIIPETVLQNLVAGFFSIPLE